MHLVVPLAHGTCRARAQQARAYAYASVVADVQRASVRAVVDAVSLVCESVISQH